MSILKSKTLIVLSTSKMFNLTLGKSFEIQFLTIFLLDFIKELIDYEIENVSFL